MAPEKLETDLHVKVVPVKFYEVCSDKAYEIPDISPLIVKEGILVEGEWGKKGSIIIWKYVNAGKLKVAKVVIEAVDRKNNAITYKVVEGDLLESYKNFKVQVQVRADKEDGGSVVRWIFEYEKLRGDVSDPYTLMYMFIELSKDVECYLLKC